MSTTAMQAEQQSERERFTEADIRNAWRAWPRQAVTGADRAIEFVRFLEARAALSHPSTPKGSDATDAVRYRWLRAQVWTENTLGVVLRPKDNTKLGCFLPFGELLDGVIDHMQADLPPPEQAGKE